MAQRFPQHATCESLSGRRSNEDESGVRENADGQGIEVLARSKLRVDAKDLLIVFA